jgi:hypothetical protein
MLVPAATIGRQAVSGFQEQDWQGWLDSAGYPRTRALPAGWQPAPATPLVPRTAAQEAELVRNLPRWRELLGTDDFVWRRYDDASGRSLWVVALFHDSNWKSVHPPRICIEGSNMDILRDDEAPFDELAPGCTAGRIVARSRSDGMEYVTMSLYGAADWAAGGYGDFVLHHLPRALVRAPMSGFLLRVESAVLPGECSPRAAQRAPKCLSARAACCP